MVAQMPTVLRYFGKLSALTKLKLMNSYCSRFYGCELWDLTNGCVNDICITWRKEIRRVWGLPCNTDCDVLPVLCDALHVFDVLCKRVLFFWLTCINSDCNIVSFVSSCRYAVLYGRMLSPLGRNALCCSLRYGFDISSFLSSLINLGEVCWRHHLSNVSTSLQAEVDVIKDMVMLTEDKQQCIFTSNEIETVIKSLCTE